MSKSISFSSLIGAACVAILASSAHAGIVINVSEQVVGGSWAIVADYTGSIDMTGLSSTGSGTIGNGSPQYLLEVTPNQARLSLHAGSVNFFTVTPSNQPFGTGGSNIYVRAPETLGSLKQYSYTTPAPAFGILGNSLAIPVGYAGEAFNYSTNYLTTTFATWGLTPSTSFTYTLANSQTVTLNIAASSVPEIDPAGVGSVVALLAGAFGLVERRRVKSA